MNKTSKNTNATKTPRATKKASASSNVLSPAQAVGLAELLVPGSVEGWAQVETSVDPHLQEIANGTDIADEELQDMINDGLVVLPPAQVLQVETKTEARVLKTVTLTLPLTRMAGTYVGATYEGKEVWFDKKSIEAFELNEADKMVSITMARSKALRRKLIAA